MADPASSDELFKMWRQQVQAGADAWTKATQQAATQGQVPPSPPDPTQFWRQFTDQPSAPWAPFQGGGPANPDMLRQWKKFLDDWIAAWSKTLEETMSTPAFAEALGKTLDQFLNVQGKAKQAAARANKATLDALGLPSRDQIVGLSRQLMDLEDRLEGLEDKIDAAGPAARPTGAGTRGRSRKTATRKTATRKTAAKKTSARKSGARKTVTKRPKPKK